MSNAKSLIEAALFIAGRPISFTELAELSGASKEDVKVFTDELSAEYSSRGSAVKIEVGKAKAHMQLDPALEDAVMMLAPAMEMSQAMLKTLAVIAHDEPVKQSELVKSRGTRVYYYIKKLTDMELVSGRRKGRTKLLSTTTKFKEYFKVDKIPKAVKPLDEHVIEAEG
ncbi:MAG: SMC-Scp complex subunit ScpB [Candidatus Altiarchaeota archaeon]